MRVRVDDGVTQRSFFQVFDTWRLLFIQSVLISKPMFVLLETLITLDVITVRQTLAFHFFQCAQMGHLPWSHIFLDMTSFIIHPSTEPLISFLSETYSSPFFFFPSFTRITFTFHKSAMSLLLSLSLFVCLWC